MRDSMEERVEEWRRACESVAVELPDDLDPSRLPEHVLRKLGVGRVEGG